MAAASESSCAVAEATTSTGSTWRRVMLGADEYFLQEMLNADYGAYAWPCAVRLAQYLWLIQNELSKSTVVEIGAGVGFPSIVASRCGAADVVVTDRSDAPDVLANCTATAARNNAQSCRIAALDWGRFPPSVFALPAPDFVLASDCFYDPADYDAVLATIVFLLRRKPGARCLVAYQDRSSEFELGAFADKWGLVISELVDDVELLDEDCPVQGMGLLDSCSVHLLELRTKGSREERENLHQQEQEEDQGESSIDQVVDRRAAG
eukprot:m.187764 g.187764  ORF g.187764 m.187764 type:complete len:265 (+) comp10552_c1_seq1:224-1018(+)